MSRAKRKEEVQEETREEVVKIKNEEITEENDPVTEAIKQAFSDATNDGKDEDGIKMSMIMAGAKFSNVVRLYNIFMVEFGFKKSSAEKKSILDDILLSLDLTDEDVFNDSIEQVSAALDSSDKSSAASIRQWCKHNDREYFKPEKPEKGEGRSSFLTSVFDWLLSEENDNATIEDFWSWMQSVATPNTLRSKTYFYSIYEFRNKIKAKYQ